MKKIFFFILIISIVSCKKQAETEIQLTQAEPHIIFPEDVNSDIKGEYYIDGIFNGKYLCFSPTTSPIDTFSNAYYFDQSIGLDQLNLIRMNNERTAQMQMYFGQSKMLTRKLPYYLPHENLAVCEFTQFQFYNERKRSGIENGPNDNYTYQASTNTGMQLNVSSFSNNIIEGTFQGTLRTNTGLIIKVTNGSFKIKIFIMSSD